MAALAGCAASPRAALQRWNGRERRRHARSRRAARLAALRAGMGVAPAWAHAVARTRHYQRPKNSRGRARRAAVSRPLAASPLEARAAAMGHYLYQSWGPRSRILADVSFCPLLNLSTGIVCGGPPLAIATDIFNRDRGAGRPKNGCGWQGF